MNPKHERITKRLGQGLLVVVSILIAFGLDAFWEDSKERGDLHEDLANISAELQENRARVEYHLDMSQRMVDAFDVLLGAIDSEQGAATVPDTTLWLTTITPSLDASLGAIDALIASGRMAVVSNSELSRRLAGLRDRVHDAVEEQVQATEVQYSLVIPHLRKNSWQGIGHIGDDFWAQERVPGRSLEHRSDLVFHYGADVVSGLNVRRVLYYVTVGEFLALLDEFDAIEDLIEAEVGS